MSAISPNPAIEVITAEVILQYFPSKTVRPLKLINYNNKRYNKVFLEINLAPAVAIPESILSETIFLVSWNDSQAQSVLMMVDLIRLPLRQVSNALTYASNGMDAAAFRAWWKETNPLCDEDPSMAVYIYASLL